MILEGFGWPAPHFAHMSIVLGNDRKKLSKRHGAASVNDYLEQSILKDALVNFLALLGWSPSDNKEIRPLAEIVKDFRLEKLTKSPAIFDTEKLHWMNGEYIRAMPIEEFAEKARPFIVKAGFDPDARGKAWLLPVLDSVRGHLKMLSEIGPHLEIYFAEKYTVDADASDVLKTDDGKKVVAAFRAELEKCETPTGEWLDSAQNAIKASTGAKGKGLFFPLRACVTGRLHGPELKIVLPLIGKEEALRRVDLALQ
jgi:nondiscriminating glutamyl-tRNA synthetase